MCRFKKKENPAHEFGNVKYFLQNKKTFLRQILIKIQTYSQNIFLLFFRLILIIIPRCWKKKYISQNQPDSNSFSVKTSMANNSFVLKELPTFKKKRTIWKTTLNKKFLCCEVSVVPILAYRPVLMSNTKTASSSSAVMLCVVSVMWWIGTSTEMSTLWDAELIWWEMVENVKAESEREN